MLVKNNFVKTSPILTSLIVEKWRAMCDHATVLPTTWQMPYKFPVGWTPLESVVKNQKHQP